MKDYETVPRWVLRRKDNGKAIVVHETADYNIAYAAMSALNISNEDVRWHAEEITMSVDSNIMKQGDNDE
jgi:hypothetical protein